MTSSLLRFVAFPLIPTPRNGAAVNSRYRQSRQVVNADRLCLLWSGGRTLQQSPPPPTRSLKQTVQDCLAVQGNANSACHQTLSSGASTSKHRERHRRGVKLRHLLWGHASCEDSAERLQRLTAREALVSLGLSYSGLGMFWLGRLGPWVFVQELELRRCQAQEEQLRMEAGIGRPTDTEWQGPAGAQVCEHQLSRAQMEQDDFCLCRGGLFESPCSAVRYCAVVNAHKQHSDFISSSVCGIPTDSHSTKRCSCQFSLSAIKTGRECRSSLLAVVRRADTATVPPPPNTVAEADCSRLSCCAGQCELSLPPNVVFRCFHFEAPRTAPQRC